MKQYFYSFPMLIITLLLALSCSVHSQQIDPVNCSNYYNQDNLPSDCDLNSKTCIFPPISNTSLITNKTDLEEYGLCLDLLQYTVVMLSGRDRLSEAFYMTATTVIFSSGYSLSTTSNVVILSNNISMVGTNVTASMLWLQAQNIQLLDSNIINDDDFGLFCSPSTINSYCSDTNFYFPFLFNSIYFIGNFNLSLLNYTYNNWIFKDYGVNSVVLLAQDQITVTDSLVAVSVTAVYTTILQVSNSSFNSTGLGYSSGTGPGCGYFDEVLNQLLGCTGTGASHGGYGGNSGPQNCNLLVSSPPYDRQLIPKFPGSGGGFFLKELKQVSSGGGVINVQVDSLILDNSVFLANGIGGIQGGGGGSGGSISIDYCSPTISGLVNISANGGSAKSSGGGGRVRFFYHNWTSIFSPYQQGIPSLKITAYGGSDCDSKLTCGQNGSIIASPCPPGYSLNYTSYTCQLCPTGTYQLNYGYERCQLCQNKPQNSYYQTPNSSVYNNYTYVCIFKCNNNETTGVYKLSKDNQCLSSFNYILEDVGGINIIICVGIVVGTLIIFMVIMMIRKLSFSDRNLYEQSQHEDSFRKKSYFKIEDIPFHQLRIYFDGANTPTSPWQISPHVEQRLLALEEYSSYLPDLVRLFRALNQVALYPRSVYWLVWMLKIYYYPLGIFLASKMREKKSKQIRNELVRRTRQKFDVNVGIKMHVNIKYTVGCLEIFNYNKETLDYYIKNYFPIYFKLQKLLIGGYGIDFTDPLFRALCGQFEEKSEKNDRLEDYLIQLNQLLRNSDQTLVIFKHLWKINNVWPSLQCHLWQPDNIILGINDKNEIDKDKALFLVFTTEGKEGPSSNNSNMILNRSLPLTSVVLSEYSQKLAESKTSRHFLYTCNLPNFFFDQITCIRHKYHLREAMIQAEEKRTIFWELDNNFSEKSLSWVLGCTSIGDLLLTLLSFFLIIFLLVDRENFLLLAFIPYFALFPFCQFLMIFLQFSLLISKGARVFSFALYFTLFSAIKMGIVSIIQLVLVILDDHENNIILVVLFFVWIFMLICSLVGLLLLSMLHVHYIKTR